MRANDPNLPRLESIVRALGNAADDVVIVGGCAAGLLITDAAQSLIRTTLDVDAVVEVFSLIEYYQFEEKLRELGFKQPPEIDGPKCRWFYGDTQFDLMASQPGVTADSNPWYPLAVETAEEQQLPSGLDFKLISAPVFLGTKLSAFADRGGGDYYASQDMEDIFAVIDGRAEIVQEMETANPELRQFVRDELRAHKEQRDFWDSLTGFYRAASEESDRVPDFRRRLQSMLE